MAAPRGNIVSAILDVLEEHFGDRLLNQNDANRVFELAGELQELYERLPLSPEELRSQPTG